MCSGTMDVTDVRCCDMAALVALINMLKVNLGSAPEIYNTLLAVLCDFDPYKHGNRERTVRYIRLLVSDKVLANCLLMSLPHGDPGFQHLSLSTGSMPDMKKAIKQKFLGMKLSTLSPQHRSREQTDEPVDKPVDKPVDNAGITTNQNLTILVSDHEETGSNSEQNTYNHSLLQTNSQAFSDPHKFSTASTGSNMSSAQTKCIITFTKTSTGNFGKSVAYGSKVNSDYNIASSATQSSQSVAQAKTGNGEKSNKSKSSAIPENIIQVSTVMNSSTVTLQSCAALGVSGQSGKQTSASHVTSSPAGLQNQPQTTKTSMDSIPQARLPGAILPFPYQSYTYPFQGNMSYHPFLTGTTINSLIPWTPLHYIPGYLPPHHTLGTVGHYMRSSSVSGMEDTSLDLSVRHDSSATSQTSPAEREENGKIFSGSKKGGKRSASTTFIPTVGDEPKRKEQRLSVEIPVCPKTGNRKPDIGEDSQKCSTSGTNYLCMSDDNEIKDNKQLNSLQALQELTSSISPKPRLATGKKSSSGGSITEMQQDPKLNDKQKAIILGGKTTSFSSGRHKESQNLPIAYFSPRLPHAYKDCTRITVTSNSPLTTANAQYAIASSWSKKGNVLPYNSKDYSGLFYGKRKPFEQSPPSCQSSSVSETVLDVSSTWNDSTFTSKSEKFGTVCLLENYQNRCTSLRHFPYSQQIQLPDGKYSVVDFPAHSKSNTQSSERTVLTNKNAPTIQNSRKVSSMSDSKLESADVHLDQISQDGSNQRDHSSQFLQHLKRHETVGPLKGMDEKELKSLVTPENSGNNGSEIDRDNTNKTCLIIETMSENGTEQVQFKLDKHSSVSLLGELLKLKPMQNSSPCVRSNECNSSDNSSQKSLTSFNNDGHGLKGDNTLRNIESIPREHMQGKNDTISEPDISFSSLNVSPYLLGMLPDTTTFSDQYEDDGDDENDDRENEESYSDEGDDDVFIHPIF